MRKFLSALNLVCVMFIFGCSKNSNDLKTYNLEFSEILNTVLFRDNYSLNIESVKNKLPADVLASTSGYALFEISFVDGSSWQKIINFYKDNGVKSSDNNRYSIDKIINAKITLTKFESRHYYITSFFAEMPNKN